MSFECEQIRVFILNMLKFLDPIHRRTYGHCKNNRFDSFVYTNKQYSSFFQIRHTSNLERNPKQRACQQ